MSEANNVPEAAPALDVPTHLGIYRIERRLGRGGMGEVFLAWDERLERHVAIKRIRGDKHIDSRGRARFRREARAIARLSHPVIVQIFDIIDIEEGDCIVMEYVDGKSLDRLLAGPRLALEFVLELAAEIADGLSQAHAKGLIHRDLKPQNVIVTPSGHAKLLDFGLARMLSGRKSVSGEADAEVEESLTQPGLVVGTPSAMSPEQVLGHEVDFRSDLFALGALLYQMVTGRAPFAGRTALESLYKVGHHSPPTVNELCPEVPAGLSGLIHALLAKAPTERPASAHGVMAELERMIQAPASVKRGTQPDAPLLVGGQRLTPAEVAALANQSTSALIPRVPAPGPAVRSDHEPARSIPVVRVLVLVEFGTGSPSSGRFVVTEASAHELAVRDALAHFGGLEAPGTERGRLWVFERSTEAVGFALACHRAVAQRAREQDASLAVRVAVHLGEVTVHSGSSEPAASPGGPLLVSGPPTLVCARLLSLALPGQTLVTRTAFDLARQPAARGPLAGVELQWLAHGTYALREIEQPMELFEVGVRGSAPLRTPPDAPEGKRLVAAQDEATLGWRPAKGQTIPQRPNWSLRERLGQGGLGEVWLATHPSGEKRVFKFCFEAARLRALKREITLVRLLEGALGQRQDIARVLDWDVTAAPYFIESEYTEGGDLVDWSDEQGGIAEVPLATRLSLLAEVADALAAAHSVGVLHKDVKPQNVLITRDREGHPRARLADFGIGLVLDRERLGAPDLSGLGFTHTLGTASSVAAGTPGYLAPELLEGRAPSIQADVYALGVMLYQAAAGDFSRTLAPGWQRDIEDPLLAQDIATLVDRAPERRPASATEVALKLRTLEERRAGLARAEQARRAAAEAEQELQRARRRRRFAAWGSVPAVLLLMVVSAFAWQTEQARERERLAREHADRRRVQAEQLIDFMLVDLRGKLQPLGKLAILNDLGQRALEYFAAVPETELSDQELHSRAQALHQLGEVRVSLGNLTEATQAFREALRLSESLATRSPGDLERQFDLGQSQFWVGYLLWQQRDMRNALPHFQAYLTVSEELVARDSRNPKWLLELAYAHSNMGSMAIEMGNHASAQTSLRASSGIMETLLARAPEDDELRLQLAHVHAKLGKLLWDEGELAGASAWFEKHLAAMTTLSARAPDDMERLRFLGHAHGHLGHLLRQRGDVEGALSHFREEMAVTERLVAHDPDDRSLVQEWALCKSKLAALAILRGEWDEARELHTAERGAIDALLAHDPQRQEWRFALARNLRSVAALLEARGQFSPALKQARASVDLLEEVAAASPMDREQTLLFAYTRWILGRLYQRLGAPDRAHSEWVQGLALITPLTQDDGILFLYEVQVRLLLSLGRGEEARPLLATLGRMGYHEPALVPFLREQGMTVEPSSRNSTAP